MKCQSFLQKTQPLLWELWLLLFLFTKHIQIANNTIAYYWKNFKHRRDGIGTTWNYWVNPSTNFYIRYLKAFPCGKPEQLILLPIHQVSVFKSDTNQSVLAIGRPLLIIFAPLVYPLPSGEKLAHTAVNKGIKSLSGWGVAGNLEQGVRWMRYDQGRGFLDKCHGHYQSFHL